VNELTPKSPSSTEATEIGRRKYFWPVVVLLLAAHAALAVDCANRLSVTHDEYWHLPVGLLNLKTGEFWYDNLNPPLVRMWAALPLLGSANAPDPIDARVDATGVGDAFLRANADRYGALFARGRWMIAALSVATGLLLAVWARELFGDAAACITVLLWSTCPTALMNASLVTTDMGAAFFSVAALYAAWKFACCPNWKQALAMGLLLGLAQLAKFTSILLFPLAVAFWLLVRMGNKSVARESTWPGVLQWAMAIVLSVIVWNAGYLFRGSFQPLGEYTFHSRSMQSVARRLEAFKSVPVPLPRDYVTGLDRQRHVMESEHPAYLDGQWSTTGFWDYYWKAMWHKLPHALQLLCLLSCLFVLFPGGQPRQLRIQVALLLPAAALMAIAGGSAMQLGIRYLLPMIPFLALFAGQAGRWFDWRRYRLRTVLVALPIVAALFSVRHHPHHLAYFNELAGGPANGHMHLLDSNIDWGQDLRALGRYLEENHIDDVGLAYFGTVPPSSVGIKYHVPPREPRPGWYAISTNFLQGRPHWVRNPDGSIRPVDFDEFGYFRWFARTPALAARIGYSIWVFHIPEPGDSPDQ
jgi:hypothetical protein